MKTCWQVLGIEATTDTDAIRQAYLALLPSFHPETDPQGFKQLREAYENALQGTTSPAITVVDEDPDTPWVNYLREIFGDLLADSLACAEEPSAALLQSLVTKLDAPDICPLEALVIRGLLGRAAAVATPCEAVVADEEPVTTVTSPSTEESGGGFGLWQVIKIILFIGVVGHVLRQFMH